jgi:hypothetical protein
MDMRPILIGFLLYGLFPLWVLAGVADYLCHRRTRIEATSGAHESTLHVLQAAQLGVAIFVGLFLEINALALAIMLAAVLAHIATSFWDTAYAAPRRHISPFEQHVHHYLEMLPLVAMALVAFLHWDQFAALFGAGATRPSFALQWKVNGIPGGLLAVIIGAILILDGIPLAEEFVRTRRWQRVH